jgi:5-methyltetrahydropteroyltriglutamate--homocysteine methyltransferase
MRPPFRADHVGSLLRSAALADARQRYRDGQVSATDLRAIEDEHIAEVIRRQEAIGLQSVTDGELRRDWWHLDFLAQLGGVSLMENREPTFGSQTGQPPIIQVTGKLTYDSTTMIDHFKFLLAHTSRVAKFTIPSPSMLHLRGGRRAISATIYPDLDLFWADAAEVYRSAIADFYRAGCRYLQLDDVAFAYLGDANFRELVRGHGDDPDSLPARYAQTINEALRDKPADMGVTMHTCHGNFRSVSGTQGTYDEVVEAMFSTDIDGYFMEFDSQRWGGFEPLRLLPKNKKVVLGLITTKVGEIESKSEVEKRIELASRYVPLENLCLSPQCGFSSTYHGNALSESDQWRKLELVISIANEIWR